MSPPTCRGREPAPSVWACYFLPMAETSLATLDALVAAAGVGRSPARLRQLRWVAGELALFVAQYADADAGDQRIRRPKRLADWFDQALIGPFLAAADTGTLRRRGAVGRPSGDATRSVRRSCLRILARQAGVPDPVPDEVPRPAPLTRVDPVPAGMAIGHLATRADRVRSAGAVRAAAMAAVTRELGLRTGEMAALTVADVDLAAGTLTWRPAAPRSGPSPEPKTAHLTRATLAALHDWLDVRPALVTMAPRSKALWVSIRGNHDGSGVRRPPGMPLRPNGIRRSHDRAVQDCNVNLAGEPGYQPLPRVPGRLRPDEPSDS
jgi:integrase